MKCLKLFILLIIVSFSTVCFSQNKINRYNKNTKELKNILNDYQSPLKGKTVLLINYFSPKVGSYLWFLNESESSLQGALTDKPYDLHAGIYLEDHGGLLEKVVFKDFAGGLSQPNYLLDYCLIEDDNGNPTFYLTYFMDSDGLDAKPLKVIIYTRNGKIFTKSKITAWIPFQEEDKYRIDKDHSFNLLPTKTQNKALQILKDIKEKNII